MTHVSPVVDIVCATEVVEGIGVELTYILIVVPGKESFNISKMFQNLKMTYKTFKYFL